MFATEIKIGLEAAVLCNEEAGNLLHCHREADCGEEYSRSGISTVIVDRSYKINC